MWKNLFNTKIAFVIVFCFTICLSGCNPNTNQSNTNGSNANANQSNENSNSATMPTLTEPPSGEVQTPDSINANQINTSESLPETKIETGLIDGTKVRLIVSGQELVNHWAIIMNDEVLVPDYTYVFGHLKNADGVESAGFESMGGWADKNVNIENALIENSRYSINITEGEYSFICNDETIPLTVPAQKIDGHFVVPLIALAKAIDASVEWDEAAQAISLFY